MHSNEKLGVISKKNPASTKKMAEFKSRARDKTEFLEPLSYYAQTKNILFPSYWDTSVYWA